MRICFTARRRDGNLFVLGFQICQKDRGERKIEVRKMRANKKSEEENKCETDDKMRNRRLHMIHVHIDKYETHTQKEWGV